MEDKIGVKEPMMVDQMVDQMVSPVPYRVMMNYKVIHAPRQPSPLAFSNSMRDEEEEELNTRSSSDISTVYSSPRYSNNDNNNLANVYSSNSTTNISSIDTECEEQIDKIPLFVHGDQVLIFNNECMKELSIKYGITGQLAGTLPLAPQQNQLLGFPWKLSLYEVLYCIYLNVGILIDNEEVINEGYLKEFIMDEKLCEYMINDLNNRLNKWRNDKQKEIEEQMKKLNINNTKFKKRGPKVKIIDDQNNLINSASMPDLQQVLNEKEQEERQMIEAKRRQREIEEKSKRNNIVFMEIPSDDSKVTKLWEDKLSKYFTSEYKRKKECLLLERMIYNEIDSIDCENDDIIIKLEKIKSNFKMFTYLKNKGYYLLPGMRFGGTFVSYPGDPLRYHSKHIVETFNYYDEDIKLFKLCNRGRLATGVRKVWVIGGDKNSKSEEDGNEDTNLAERVLTAGSNNEDMCCFSIEWAGF